METCWRLFIHTSNLNSNLTNEKLKVNHYKTKARKHQLLDITADDLSIYLMYSQGFKKT